MISTAIPALKSKSAKELTNLSLIAKYIEDEKSVINSLYNLYVSFCKKTINSKNPDFVADEKYDLQLVGLAALADIMPMKNENRTFVKNAIKKAQKNTSPNQSILGTWNISALAKIAIVLVAKRVNKNKIKATKNL